MSDFYDSRNSIYCYKDTNVLINRFGIKDTKKLEEVERKIVLVKLYDLRQNTKIGDFSTKHFISIHKDLFGDIYQFAGQFRVENIAKDNFRFAEWNFIESELNKILKELADENYLKGLEKDKLSKRLAYYMSELNVLHPFRDGNGRTIREFIRQLAYTNGYLLDLQKAEPHDILTAAIRSVVNTDELEKILYQCLVKDEKNN